MARLHAAIRRKRKYQRDISRKVIRPRCMSAGMKLEDVLPQNRQQFLKRMECHWILAGLYELAVCEKTTPILLQRRSARTRAKNLFCALPLLIVYQLVLPNKVEKHVPASIWRLLINKCPSICINSKLKNVFLGARSHKRTQSTDAGTATHEICAQSMVCPCHRSSAINRNIQ